MKALKRYKGYTRTVVYFTGNRDMVEDDKDFEWSKTSEQLKANDIFITDDEYLWYHNCIDDVKEYLEENLVDETFMVGSSSGGYAALLFGDMFKVPSITFGPQTVLSSLYSNRYKKELVGKVANIERGTNYKKYLDLSYIKGTDHELHYCSRYEHDVWFAERMDVLRIPHKCDRHSVAGIIKDRGQLIETIEKFMERRTLCR